jgi:voltage-gated potassium channel
MRQVLYSALLLIATILVGAFGYKLILGDHMTLFQAFYMTIITLSTVGFGEIVDLSMHPWARIFTMFLILAGMGNLLFAISTFTAFIVDGDIKKYIRRRKIMKTVENFQNHFIVCGAGTTGIHIVDELHATKNPFVVVESNHDLYEKLLVTYPGIAAIEGDATEDQTLIDAGIHKAKAVAAVLSLDKDNLFLTITARHLNPHVRIISKVVNLENRVKLTRAGAASVVGPQYIGGLRIVSELIRPTVVGFLDTLLRDRENLRIEEITVPENAWVIGKTLKEIDLTEHVGLQIIALKEKAKHNYNYHPRSNDTVSEGMVFITIANSEQTKKLSDYVSSVSRPKT